MGELYKLDFANGKSYVGITELNSAKRFSGHAKAAKNSLKGAVYSAWRKHGEPKMTVLAIVENSDLAETEIRAIAAFNTLAPNGYNILEGGQTSPMKNPDVVAKCSRSHTGKKRSAEHVEKMRASLLGKKRTKETCKRISDSLKGNKNCVGVKHTELSRNNMSIGMMGNKNGVGHKKSEEFKVMMRGNKFSAGTFWITDGVSSRLLKPNALIPDGWRRGRIQQGRC